MNTKLCDIADIRLGHPFRGSIEAKQDGDTAVVQVRDIDSSGEIGWDGVVTTKLTGRKQPDWLTTGDILFVAKGAKHYAAVVEQVPEHTVCSPHFFLIRLKTSSQKSVLPGFISWQLNQLPAQRYFQTTAEGSLYVSIRRQVLENVPVVLPPMDKQRQLLGLHQCAVKEQKILQGLMDNRQKQLAAIANDLLDQRSA